MISQLCFFLIKTSYTEYFKPNSLILALNVGEILKSIYLLFFCVKKNKETSKTIEMNVYFNRHSFYSVQITCYKVLYCMKSIFFNPRLLSIKKKKVTDSLKEKRGGLFKVTTGAFAVCLNQFFLKRKRERARAFIYDKYVV
jgi:hypothetical protein